MVFRYSLISLIFIFFTNLAPVHAQENVKESEQLDFAQGLLTRGMYDMAIIQYQKFITDYPHSSLLAEAYLSLGEVYFLSQDFDKAIDVFNQFMTRFPNSDQLPVSMLRLAQIDIQQKKYDEAIKELTSMPQKNLKEEMLQSFDFYTAQAYAGLADNASALKFYQKAVQDYDQGQYTSYALKEMGKIYVTNSDFKEAMDVYTKSIAQAKDNDLKDELTYRLAELQFMSGQFPEAIKGFEALLEENPSSGFSQDALINLFLAYFNSSQFEGLLKAYEKKSSLIKDEAGYFSIHMSAVLANIELKNYDQANKLLDKVLSFSGLSLSQKVKLLTKKADILNRQKKYKDALVLLDSFTAEKTDEEDEVLFLKAQAYFGLGQFDKAFNFYENVFINFPNSRFSKAALLGQAHCRKEAERFKESEVLFQKYVDIQDQPDLKSEALYDAVMMALKAGDEDGILSLGQQYLKTFPQSGHYGDVLLILADQEGQNNKSQDAVNLLQGYLTQATAALRPNASNFVLAYNQQLLGHADDALAAYAKVDPQKEEGKFYVAALKNMAIIYLQQKNFDKAKEYFDRLISQGDKNVLQVKTYIWVCNEYLKGQKYDDVLRIVAEAQKVFPAHELLEINYFKAEALRGLGRCDEADQIYDLVTASSDKNAFTGEAHIGHGLCFEKNRQFDQAENEFNKSLDENAEDVTITIHARFELANAFASQGNMTQALRFYLLVATIYDDDYYCSQSLFQAGKILEKLKRRADALKMYKEILDKYKDSLVAAEARERFKVLP